MSADEPFLSRWSKRKIEARAGVEHAPTPPVVAVVPPPALADSGLPAEPPAPPEPLPPVESLTPESDIRAFMQADVAPHLKNRALRTLFRDPHFNVMDGLDTYIDDYSKADPLPASWLAQLNQMSHLGDVAKVPEEAPEETPEVMEKSEASPAPGDIDDPPEMTPEQGLVEPAAADPSVTVDATVTLPRVVE